jgi:hypothetical protein
MSEREREREIHKDGFQFLYDKCLRDFRLAACSPTPNALKIDFLVSAPELSEEMQKNPGAQEFVKATIQSAVLANWKEAKTNSRFSMTEDQFVAAVQEHISTNDHISFGFAVYPPELPDGESAELPRHLIEERIDVCGSALEALIDKEARNWFNKAYAAEIQKDGRGG